MFSTIFLNFKNSFQTKCQDIAFNVFSPQYLDAIQKVFLRVDGPDLPSDAAVSPQFKKVKYERPRRAECFCAHHRPTSRRLLSHAIVSGEKVHCYTNTEKRKRS